jgi:hypothetical protein
MCLFCGEDVCDVCAHHHTCKHCGEIADSLIDGYCEVCHDIVACTNCGAIDNSIESPDGDYYCQECFNEQFVNCANCDDVLNIDDCEEYDRLHYCDDCFHETFTHCDNCGETIYQDDSVILDEVFCEDCAEQYKCHGCGDYTKDGDIIGCDYYCDECRDDLFTTCDDCWELVDRDEITIVGNRCVCNDCMDDYFCCENCCEYYHMDDYGGEYLCNDCYNEVCGPGDPIIGTSTDRIGSSRCFGIEIETYNGDYAYRPEGWGCKEDGSIRGMELVSPIMAGDRGLESIEELYSSVEPEFDYRCGIHVHIDVRDLSKEQRFEVIKAFKDNKAYWFSRVDSSRHKNTFCGGDYGEIKEDDNYDSYMNRIGGERYVWCNLQSIYKFGTIEIRLLEGTENVDKVVAWVTDLLQFVDEAVVKV